MAESTVIYDPGQNQGNILPLAMMANGGFGGMNSAWPWLFAMNGGGFGGFGGWGGLNGIVDIFGLAIVAQMFGWNNGGLGGNGAGMAGFISNQLNNDSGRELLMNAITSQGEASRAAVQNLATMLGQDFNLVNAAVLNVQNGISSLALQQAVSVPQIINSIQAGDANLSHQLCECCCNMRQQVEGQGYQNQLRTVEQTGILGNAISTQGQRTVDAIADLKTTMVKEFCDVKERDMQSKIDTQADLITQLRNKADNAEQTQRFMGAFAVLDQKVTELAAKQPNTVPVQWPNIVAANATPYVGGVLGSYGAGFNPYGYGFGGSSYWG